MSTRLNNLHPPKGSKQNKKRVGRGNASGHGVTAGRGDNGQKSRSGYSRRFGFEGGQTPLIKRIPKRGFNNPFRKEYEIINVYQLNNFKKKNIKLKDLRESGLISRNAELIKILGDGEIDKAINIEAHKFSKSAKEKIEKAGGKVKVVS
ncbi:MAG TPA: 50S ribosomal protein L15 [Candidatus Mcinerneyibacterium sp.]|nr:50S ribosomal protein L15 [Candidatus Mcinerneyibacterium sp.]